MDETVLDPNMDLVGFIMNANEGSKVMRLAGEKGVSRGTIFLGKGTVRSKFLKTFGADSVRREIVIMASPTETAKATLDYVSETKGLSQPNNGIGFRLSLRNALGVTNITTTEKVENREDKGNMYQAVFVIVDFGDSEEIMEAAQESGAQGGTIIHGRGAGDKEARKVFNMDIEPEKDILLIISKEEKVKQIVDRVSKELNIEEANSGILFVVDLSETRGIYE